MTHLGAPLDENSLPEVSAAVDTSGKGDIARLPALLEELVKTERSYLSRIRALKSVSNCDQRRAQVAAYTDTIGLCGSTTQFREETRVNDHPSL